MTQITASWVTDDASQAVCAMLTDAGFQAWFVGGCVRNALLDAPVADIDISTNARPDRVMALAKAAGLKCIPTGIDHGTVTVVAKGVPFEVTTFRRDVETDGRRAVVVFADDMADDARRRDFTMNALYADPHGVVSDPLGGLADVQARRLRFIEDPELRIKEDTLRILRFFRFTAWYADPTKGIDAEGLAACANNLDGLEHLPAERIWAEMRKLLTAADPAPAVAAMQAGGVLMRVLAGADAATLAVLVHVEGQAGLSADPIRRLAVIGGDTGRLRLSKADQTRLALLRDDSGLARFANTHGAAIAIDRLAVQAASIGMEIDPKQMEFAYFSAAQVFPLRAADLMPDLQGAALGAALRAAKDRWIASEFTLLKDDLRG